METINNRKDFKSLKSEYSRRAKHFLTFEKMAQKIGVYFLMNIVLKDVADKETLSKAYAIDEHLNTINIGLWDKAGPVVTPFSEEEALKNKIPLFCQYTGKRLKPVVEKSQYQIWTEVFMKRLGQGISMADKVCVLKHVAKHHILEIDFREDMEKRGLR